MCPVATHVAMHYNIIENEGIKGLMHACMDGFNNAYKPIKGSSYMHSHMQVKSTIDHNNIIMVHGPGHWMI